MPSTPVHMSDVGVEQLLLTNGSEQESATTGRGGRAAEQPGTLSPVVSHGYTEPQVSQEATEAPRHQCK